MRVHLVHPSMSWYNCNDESDCFWQSVLATSDQHYLKKRCDYSPCVARLIEGEDRSLDWRLARTREDDTRLSEFTFDDKLVVMSFFTRSINILPHTSTEVPLPNNKSSSLVTTLSNWPCHEKDVSAFFQQVREIACLPRRILFWSVVQLHRFLVSTLIFIDVIEPIGLPAIDETLSLQLGVEREKCPDISNASGSTKRMKREIIISWSSKKIDFVVREWARLVVSIFLVFDSNFFWHFDDVWSRTSIGYFRWSARRSHLLPFRFEGFCFLLEDCIYFRTNA